MSETERIEAQAAEWLARRDAGGWSPARQLELDAWLAESTAHRIAYLRLRSAWERADRLSALHNPAPLPQAETPHARLPRFSLLRIAASILLVVATGSVWLGWQGSVEGERYSTGIGSRESLSLPDGSRLTLNTDSRVRAVVNEGRRTVWLERGEVYFEVAHDQARPFVVLAGERRITVLGTKFSVRRSDGRVNVVVEEGRVQVEPLQAETNATAVSRATVATRNDLMVADASHVLVIKKTSEQVANELSWRQGKLVFDQMTLAEAAGEFNRYNRKKLVILDRAAAQLRIGGSFDAANVQGFAHLLRQGFGLTVQESADEIRISS